MAANSRGSYLGIHQSCTAPSVRTVDAITSLPSTTPRDDFRQEIYPSLGRDVKLPIVMDVIVDWPRGRRYAPPRCWTLVFREARNSSTRPDIIVRELYIPTHRRFNMKAHMPAIAEMLKASEAAFVSRVSLRDINRVIDEHILPDAFGGIDSK